MTTTPDDLRVAAETQYAAIRNNQDLSADAKRRAIAKAYLSTQSNIDKIRTDLEAATNGRRDGLAKQIYGLAATDASAAVSYRDAQSRAEAIEDESAAIARLNRAMVAGDDSMVRALLEVGYSNSWAGVINAYTDRNPAKAGPAEELWNLTQNSLVQPNPFMGYLAYLAPVPAELSGLSEWKIQEIADGQPSTSQQFS